MTKDKPRDIGESRRIAVIGMKGSGLMTNRQIADEVGLSVRTVQRVAKAATPEQLEAAEPIKQRLLDRIEKVRDRALIAMEQKIELAIANNSVPLKELTTAFGVAYDKANIEHGKPTSIVMSQLTPEQHAVDFYKLLLGKHPREVAIAVFRQTSLYPLVADVTRDRVAEMIESGRLLVE